MSVPPDEDMEYELNDKGEVVKTIIRIREEREKKGECVSELPFFMNHYFCQREKGHKGKCRITFEWETDEGYES